MNVYLDYYDFQSLLLNKKVVYCADVQYIKSTDKDIQCRLGTIRILLDDFSRTRHILYFRHTPDQKHGFVEWPSMCLPYKSILTNQANESSQQTFLNPPNPFPEKQNPLPLKAQTAKHSSSPEASLDAVPKAASPPSRVSNRVLDQHMHASIRGLGVEVAVGSLSGDLWWSFVKPMVCAPLFLFLLFSFSRRE